MFSGHDLIRRLAWVRRSSALRLALFLSVIFAVGLSVAIFVALDIGRDMVVRRVDDTMAALAPTAQPSLSPTLIVQPVAALDQLPRAFANAAARGGGTITLDDAIWQSDSWRVLVAMGADGAPVLIATPLEEALDALELLGEVLWTTAATLVLLTLGIGVAAGVLAQQRVTRIGATLGRLAAGDLTARTGSVRSRDDLDDIAGQLDATAAELERLVVQTRHLSASLAHDLRTPLARLRSRLETLPEGAPRSAALEDAERLSTIFDTIMRVAKIEAAQGQAGLKKVDLGALITDVADIFAPVVEDAGKVLVTDLNAPSRVMADRDMLIQALANLIQNALVHGGDRITLFADASQLGVADNGPGVDPANYAEIVKPMVRLDAARATDGSGLGLALVRAVADRHGATLSFDKTDPHGLRVTLNLAKL